MKFHRNSTLAFPNHCDYACSIEIGHRSLWWRLLRLFGRR